MYDPQPETGFAKFPSAVRSSFVRYSAVQNPTVATISFRSNISNFPTFRVLRGSTLSSFSELGAKTRGDLCNDLIVQGLDLFRCEGPRFRLKDKPES